MKDRHVADDSWLPRLFAIAGIPAHGDLETIRDRMDALANRAAPVTRRWWKWIIALEGVTILAPLMWLCRPLNVSLSWVATITLLTVILFVTVNWWLRWRGMQKTWARARLLAEITRSLLSTQGCPRMPAIAELDILPELSLLTRSAPRSESKSFPQWRADYIKNRIEDQAEYFSEKRQEATRQRKRFSRWATLMLDIALACAFAGIVIAFSPRGESWRRMLGDFRLEIALGLAGAIAPLVLLLAQLLRGYQELNRRTARYAQQEEMLARAKERLLRASDSETAMEVVDFTERQLSAEVFEWYYHAETAEHFFLQRESARDSQGSRAAVPLKDESRVFRFLRRSLGITSAAGLFLLRVVLGRVPWIVGSGAAVLMWLAYHQPTDISERDQLRTLARLADERNDDWKPVPEKLKHGCVFIVHGLYGDVDAESEAKKWPRRCAVELAKATAPNSPDVCVVDWHQTAHTAKHDKLNIGLGFSEIENITTDLAGIRPEAREVADLLAFRIAMMILDNSESRIRRDRPLYLIGHSAGGFVVARVAILLKKFNVAPDQLHITILDTPAPDREVIQTLPDLYPEGTVDFYISSDIGGRLESLRAAMFSPKIHRYIVPPETITNDENLITTVIDRVKNVWEAHRYCFEWFIKTIEHPEKYPGEGFSLSPFANNSRRGPERSTTPH